MDMKKKCVKRGEALRKRNISGIVLMFFLFFIGAASCSPDSREEDQDVAEDVNTELESTDWPAREGQSEWEDKNNAPVAYTAEEQFAEFDADADNRISYEEFTAAIEREDYSRGWESDYIRALEHNDDPFNEYDTDHDNFLDDMEFKDLITSFGEDYEEGGE